jgi:hypothetical protein
MNGRRAVLHVRNLPVIDTFQFFGPSDTPALVEFRAEWRATGPAVQVGMGTGVAPTDPGAFLGEIARAESAIMFAAEEFAFEASGRGSTSSAGYAQIGTERNGVFL